MIFIFNKDPAPGRTGVLLPRKKGLTQVPDPPRLQGGARKGAAPDPHPLIAKKRDQDHGQPKGLGYCRIRRGIDMISGKMPVISFVFYLELE